MSSDAYQKWRTGHRGIKPGRGNAYRKRVHRWRLGAWWHLLRLQWRYRQGEPMAVYPCRWTDDYRAGQVGRQHWHVGRSDKWSRST